MKARFWFDNWLGTPIVDLLQLWEIISNLDLLISKVLDANLSWNLEDRFRLAFLDIIKKIDGVVVSSMLSDTLFRMSTASEMVTCRDLYLNLLPSWCDVPWAKKIWKKIIPLSRLVLVWRLLHNELMLDNLHFMFGFSYHSVYSFCLSAAEHIDHLFLINVYARGI